MTAALATGLPAETVVEALDRAAITHVVTVPDTHQRTVLDLIDERASPPVIRAATEDDVLGICGGLWIGGSRPVALIQQLGIFASVNALRGLTHDLAFPLAILAGMYGRETDLAVPDSPKSAVRMCTPVLDALEIPWVLVEEPADAHLIAPMLSKPFTEGGAHVVLLGAPTT
jgi:sulfopyruvate decarboxylase TPP-binding subunit